MQAELENALLKIARQPITVHCAGRTDTGVHAFAQVVHFDTQAQRPMRAWSFGVNAHMHRNVAVHWASIMPDHFHARYTALERSYRYTILNRPTRPGYQAGTLAWERAPLDSELMHEAAQCLLGEQDFSSFRSSECQANHARRCISHIAVTRQEDRIVLDITANGFLHNMVRIITGCLLAVGRGDRPIDWLAELLESRDRTRAGVTAPPQGLRFLQPRYPAEFNVPDFQALRKNPWRPDL